MGTMQNGAAGTKPIYERIIDLCEQHWEQHKNNCSGFVKAVAKDLGVSLTGQANDIVDQIQKSPWVVVSSGKEASKQASLGKLVIAGKKDKPHGHVVVVVPGKLNRGKYPTAYWGSLGGSGGKNETINFSWSVAERDNVLYACIAVPSQKKIPPPCTLDGEALVWTSRPFWSGLSWFGIRR